MVKKTYTKNIPKSPYFKQEYYVARQAMGRLANTAGWRNQQAGVIFTKSAELTNYWARKQRDLMFHPLAWGGGRNFKYDQEAREILFILLLEQNARRRTSKLHHYCSFVRRFGFEVDTKYVSKIFTEWRWSSKMADVKQMQKFTPWNNLYTIHYLLRMLVLDWRRVKFLDEASYCDKELRSRKVWGPAGTPQTLVTEHPFDATYTTIVCCSIDGRLPLPVCMTLKEGTNTSWDFVGFIVHLLDTEFLVRGDTLVLDNASIHTGRAALGIMMQLFDAYGINVLFLPTYSPEFNPVEYIHGYCKAFIRNERDEAVSLRDHIEVGHFGITLEYLVSLYRHCIARYLFPHQ